MSMQLNRILNATVLGSLLALAVTGPAQAVDGVIEINQARAKAGGVTPGDTPLFPVTLSQSGSYRLTGNLDVTDASARPGGTLAENTTAILITAAGVTIDLNGFMIKGPCTGGPPCSPLGSGRGIDAGSFGQVGVTVVNGTVQGMGDAGLVVNGRGSLVEKVRALSNGANGIDGETVTSCTAFSNAGFGIQATTVTGCTASTNGLAGIAGTSTTVTGSSAFSNKGNGITATTVANCTANSNGGFGIAAALATGCTASSNTSSPQINATGIAGHNLCTGVPCP
jgi:hypothetical protein